MGMANKKAVAEQTTGNESADNGSAATNNAYISISL